ncbi:hypothetical protein CSC94_00580 [Zhengella mangrovi]|uniref:Lipoprotein n=1 Tax=Zhengella mangrovi TaxID=1982044 RepID=A0A2G1QST7_9HYPH|nr:hypothetical protein [Zhengella mangrovi]PHP68539.1 hypothetical protein CSC94_00580 [Zhengella mangrovi]
MKTVLATLAALGFGLSAAQACGMHSAEAHDTMTTASIASDKAPMSTRTDAVETTEDDAAKAVEPVIKEEKAD